jgi:hypothetical protein
MQDAGAGRIERDREDLLRDATALVERIELTVDGFDEHVVVGFRKSGAASVYFGQDPVYHFNSAGELRRAFADGRLYKAEKGRLVSMERRRGEGVVALVGHDLSDPEMEAFLATMGRAFDALRDTIEAGRSVVVRQSPVDRDIIGRTTAWLTQLPGPPRMANRPHAC